MPLSQSIAFKRATHLQSLERRICNRLAVIFVQAGGQLGTHAVDGVQAYQLLC